MHTDTIDPVFVFYQKGENKMLHAELTDKIISSFFKVYNTLGYGFLEKVYENALVIELKLAELNVLQQKISKFTMKIRWWETISQILLLIR